MARQSVKKRKRRQPPVSVQTNAVRSEGNFPAEKNSKTDKEKLRKEAQSRFEQEISETAPSAASLKEQYQRPPVLHPVFQNSEAMRKNLELAVSISTGLDEVRRIKEIAAEDYAEIIRLKDETRSILAKLAASL